LIGKSLIKIGDLIESFQRSLKYIIVFVIGFCFALGLVVIPNFQRQEEERQVETFINNIITSAINQTEFHKESSIEGAIEDLQKYANEFSSVYKIYVFDYTFGAYESEVIFDNGNKFYVDVSVYKDDIVLNVFEPSKWPKYTISKEN